MGFLNVLFLFPLIIGGYSRGLQSSYSTELRDPELQDVSDVTMVVMGMRHANRNPGNFLENDPNKGQWGLEGDYQLNDAGKIEAYSMGRGLRYRYGQLISDRFNSSEIKAISSSADRCQHTMDLMLSGLFQPLSTDPVPLQPVSISIDKPMLRMYSVSKCEPQKDAWKPIDDQELDSIKQFFVENQEEVDYVANKTGFEGTLSGMGDVADNILNIVKLKLVLPDWIESPTLDGYTRESMLEKVLSFGEGPQIECAMYQPCRDIMAGYWLNDVLENLQGKEKGEKDSLKLAAYTSHTEITLSIMRLMGYDYDECPTSSGFIIEYKPGFVRLLYHEPNEHYNYVRAFELAKLRDDSGLSPDANGWIPLNDFVAAVRDGADPDWKAVCEIPTCEE